MNTDELKPRLRDFLRAAGVEFDEKQAKPKACCIAHAEKTPSMIINPDYVKCFGCDFSGDIFKVCGQIFNLDKFPDQIAKVRDMLGLPPEEKKSGRSGGKSKAVALSDEDAKKIYTREEFERVAEHKGYGRFIAGWKFKDWRGRVELVDVRFEKGDDKTVISFWYDGIYLKYARPPYRIFNLDKVKDDANILIVEGCKTADFAKKIPGFIPVTWNGGTGRANLAPWKLLSKCKNIFIYPDDDQQERRGSLLKWFEQPGIKAAFEIKKKLPHAVICKPVEKARKIKASGADVEEALEVMSPGELSKYIHQGPKLEPPKKETPDEITKSPDTPFRILGTDDYHRAHFIGVADRMFDFSLTSLTKNQLMDIAPLAFWESKFKEEGRMSWDGAIDMVIQSAAKKDFDPLIIRGRGAWTTDDGGILYHDGQVTTGAEDPRHLYIKKTRRDIGIADEPATLEICTQVNQINRQLTYETPLDHVRLLSWAAIAPYAGALPWRPALLLTGESKSGKSTIMDLMVKRISNAETFSGGETTEPGVRQRIKNDSCAIIIEEAEADTKKKKYRREDLFSLMRQSTSNDAPMAAKGTQSGQGIVFSMRSMFLFLAIDPSIEHAADDNRIFRINLKRPDAESQKKFITEYKPQLRELLTRKNCRAIRARTWQKLPIILEQAHVFADAIQDAFGQDARYSLAEGLLQATYHIVFKGNESLGVAEISRLMHELYSQCPPEKTRDEAEEMLDTILDSKVLIEHPERELISLRELVLGIRNRKLEHRPLKGIEDGLDSNTLAYLRAVCGRHGVMPVDGDSVAVYCKSDAIGKILQRGIGWHKMLLRHHGKVEVGKSVRMAGTSRYCIVIKMDEGEEKEKEEEKVDDGY